MQEMEFSDRLAIREYYTFTYHCGQYDDIMYLISMHPFFLESPKLFGNSKTYEKYRASWSMESVDAGVSPYVDLPI